MATHSSIPAWKTPRTEESDGLQSMGSQRVRHKGPTEHTHTRLSYREVYYILNIYEKHVTGKTFLCSPPSMMHVSCSVQRIFELKSDVHYSHSVK